MTGRLLGARLAILVLGMLVVVSACAHRRLVLLLSST
jgi:hypothetical protein